MGVPQRINDALIGLLDLEHRIDPWVRPAFDRVLKRPLVGVAQALINARREDLHLGLAEERILPGEEEATAAVIETMSAFTLRLYGDHPPALRAGNTKTYGAVRATFEVRHDLPEHVRRGVFAEERTYPAWVRFGGPGPIAPPDVKDAGIMSIGIKLMGVPGDKLLDDERWTQDFTGITAPTFTTPNVIENLKLQRHIGNGTPIFYFLGPRHPHLLDAVMQGAYAKTQASPLQEEYFSCTPCLLGEGQAIRYSVKPVSVPRRRPPRHFTDNYLQGAMAETLRSVPGEVVFDFLVQLQTDAHAMPIEDASVLWPERLSPSVAVARLVIPAQEFDSPAQMAFAEDLSYNPWHSLVAHRPLGNQNRARRTIYQALSKLRHDMNGRPHVEPTGDETFSV
ncbi:MAG TPA: catalase family protein [Actinomycetota bacterium]|nr:catalase family protein [Actinomycetota bacterium]